MTLSRRSLEFSDVLDDIESEVAAQVGEADAVLEVSNADVDTVIATDPTAP